MIDTVGRHLVLLAAIAAATYIITTGDPNDAKEWGGLASAAISALVLWQNRTQTERLNQAQHERHELSRKVETVHDQLNGKATADLESTRREAYAHGIRDALAHVQPAIEKAASAALSQQPKEP